ncbi:MAG: hypothetical protein IKP40_13510 [Clostridia bacterium]|nr:hypothetical protein [Clostridia bacterium]
MQDTVEIRPYQSELVFLKAHAAVSLVFLVIVLVIDRIIAHGLPVLMIVISLVNPIVQILIRMSKGRFHELSHDWLWKTAEITTTSRGSKVESALLSPLPILIFVFVSKTHNVRICLSPDGCMIENQRTLDQRSMAWDDVRFVYNTYNGKAEFFILSACELAASEQSLIMFKFDFAGGMGTKEYMILPLREHRKEIDRYLTAYCSCTKLPVRSW